MGQVLVNEKGRMDFDQTYVDGGETPTYGMVAGQRTLLKDGAPAKPMFGRRGKAFFYMDGTPVNDEQHVQDLPQKALVDGKIVNLRELALDFVRAQQPQAETSKRVKTGGVTLKHADNPRRVRKQTLPGPKEIVLDGGKLIGQTRAAKVNEPD